MAIRVGCLKSDAPVFQGNEKRVVVQFADLAAWAKDAEKKNLLVKQGWENGWNVLKDGDGHTNASVFACVLVSVHFVP